MIRSEKISPKADIAPRGDLIFQLFFNDQRVGNHIM